MKLTAILLFGFLMQVSATGTSQTITLSESNVPLKKVFKEIQKQTGYDFLYTYEVVQNAGKVTIRIKNATLQQALDEVLDGKNLQYKILEKTVVIKAEQALETSLKNIDVLTLQIPPPIIVTGKVTGANGEPLAGVSVLVKGSSVGAKTNEEGEFTIENVDDKATLVFSSVGYETKEVQLNGSRQIVVKLTLVISSLGEIKINTGYESLRREEFTGSASIINAKKFNEVPMVSIVNRIAGAVPGMQITSSSGQPGANESIRIRGMGSINASNDPLFVLDGVPVISGNISNVGPRAAGLSIMSSLNPNDIESITVIKDAAAASLYGSRAGNGVIVITTKQGRNAKSNYQFQIDRGYSEMAVNYRPLLNPDSRYALLLGGLYNAASDAGIAPGQAQDDWVNNNSMIYYITKPLVGWTDWRKLLMRRGETANYQISASGGNEKTNFFSSLSYSDQQGVTLNSDFGRFTGRMNITHKIKRLTIDAFTNFANINQNIDDEGGTTSPFAASSFYVSPADYAYNQDGTFNTTNGFAMIGGPAFNPLMAIKYNYSKNKTFRSTTSASAIYKLFGGLNLKQVLSYDYINNIGLSWSDPRTGAGKATIGKSLRSIDNYETLISQSQVHYDNNFGKHNITAMFSFELEDNVFKSITAQGTQFSNFGLPEVVNAGNTTGSSNLKESTLASFVSRLTYNYNQIYYGALSYRRDGSSRLAPEGRWGDFWSLSGAWRVSKEDFWKNSGLGHWLTDFKLRASFGENGTLPTDFYGYFGLFSYGNNYMDMPGAVETNIPNPNIRWERNLAFNSGIDISIKRGINLSIDVYNRDTRDLLINRPISLITGFGSILQNIGSIRNWGIEFEVNSLLINKTNLTWDITLNSYHNNNKLIKLAPGQSEIIAYPFIHKVGLPYNTFYAYERAGVDTETGSQLYYKNTPIKNSQGEITGYDRSKTSVIGESQRVPFGQLEPKWAGGITNNLRWRNFGLMLTLTYSLGGNVYDHYGAYQADGANYAYSGGVGSYQDVNEMWQKSGDVKPLPRFVYNNQTYPKSDRWILSTNHIRLKNITIKYALPKNAVNAISASRIQVYISAANLFTIKKQSTYVDPEAPVSGLLTGETPPMRTITFGIELGF